MKIDCYCIGGLGEFSTSTAEIMAIYGVKLTNASGEIAAPQQISAGTICIINSVSEQASRTLLVTECWYRKSCGEIAKETESGELMRMQDNQTERKRLIKINVWQIMHRLTKTTPSPWGILRGVRPVKLANRLLDQEKNIDEASAFLEQKYLISPEKTKLILDIAKYQQKYLRNENFKRVSLYIGIPFCPTRCLYCSFPSYPLPEDRTAIAPFMEALKADIRSAARLIRENGLSVQTVYIGGGTPTSLDIGYFEELLETTARYFIGSGISEFSVEAGRPDSMDESKINLMRQYGVTRVSVNPQTMQEKTLNRIGRKHSVEDIINIFGKIRNYNFPVINMDIIAGLPGETLQDIHNTITGILALQPENITVHALALKRGSTLKTSWEACSLPDDNTVREMLAIVKEKITSAGMFPYYLYRQKYMSGQMENIGYTKPEAECIYNIQVMEERQTIIGIGPNAATKAVNSDYVLESYYFPKDVNTYIKDLNVYLDKRNSLIQALYA